MDTPLLWASSTLYTAEVEAQKRGGLLAQFKAGVSPDPMGLLALHREDFFVGARLGGLRESAPPITTVSLTQVVIENGHSEMRYESLLKEWMT